MWDAHNCEESLDEEELGVSSNYLNYWNDLVDLWYLGMQVLANLLMQVCFKNCQLSNAEFYSFHTQKFIHYIKLFSATLNNISFRFTHNQIVNKSKKKQPKSSVSW